MPAWNGRQLRSLVRALPEDGPLVLIGDLNMGPVRAGRLTGLRPVASALTFPHDQPREQLDHVLVRGDLEVGATSAPLTPISDHRPLVVDLDLRS